MSFVHSIAELVEGSETGLVGRAPHWRRVDLGRVASVVNGFPFESRYFESDRGKPVIRIRDIVPGRAATFYSGPIQEAPEVNRGELVVGMDGDFNCRLWPSDTALLNQRVCKIVPDDDFYSNRFLSYVLPAYLKLVNDHTSAVTVKHLSSNTIQELPLPLPPRSEQDRLVSKLDELFSGIEESERALERVRKLVGHYRQSVLKAAVTGELTRAWRGKHAGKLESGEVLLYRILESRREAWEKSELDKMKAKGSRPNNNEWKKKYQEPASPDTSGLPRLPEGWVWARAEQVCDFITKGTTPAAADMSLGSGEVPYIKVYNLTFDGTLDFTKEPTFISRHTHIETLKRSRVLPGDVLMNIVGPPLGKVSIVPSLYPEWNMNQAVAVFRPLQGLDRNFLTFFLLSRAAQDWYKGKAKATAGQFNLTLEICRDTPIPFPSQEEQLQIQQLISVEQSRLAMLALWLDQQNRHTLALKQSVLKAAFAGKLVTQDPTDESATALLARIAAECSGSAKRARTTFARKKKAKA